MRSIEELLREQLRRNDKALPLTRDSVLAHVTKVRRRRTAVAAAGIAVLAIGAAAALVGGLGARLGQQTGSGLPTRLYSAELLNVVFTDAQHGYVLQQRCGEDETGALPVGAPTPDVHRECVTELLATADAGQTWQERTLPAEPATKDAGVDLEFGHSLMLWVDSPGTVAFGGWNRRYWTTVDAGATWSESPTPRDVGPAGSFGTFGVGDRLVFLTSGPPGYLPLSSKTRIVPATDGSYWIRCPNAPCVRVTHDNGANWPTVSVPAQAVDWVSTSDGVTVFAGVRTASGPRLVRSTDAGATWNDVAVLAQSGAQGLALPNGDVLIINASQAGDMLRVKAGGSTPEPLIGAPAHAVIYATGGIVVAGSAWDQRTSPNVESVVSISTDGGTTWITVAPPAG